ncbi:MAG: hypothetical protein LQ350_004321 [Teloschistes chrysophthalmus]|nr:MAG: hypothetical protein LQ350_004321 [Niorma chrysophthalma]
MPLRSSCLRAVCLSRSKPILSHRTFTTTRRSLGQETRDSIADITKRPARFGYYTGTGIGILAALVIIAGVGALKSGDGPGLLGGSSISQLYPFEQYEVVKRKRLSATSTLLTIQPTTFGPRANKSRLNSQRIAELSEKGIWSVQVKHPLLTIARLYTPLPPLLTEPVRPAWIDKSGKVPVDPEEDQLRFLVRSNPDGELSKYLSRLQPGAQLELRGPYQEFEVPGEVRHIVFLAGGTGIAPALQVAHSVLERESTGRKPKIHILWANRLERDCQGAIIEPPPPPESLLGRAWSSIVGSGVPQPAIPASGSRNQSPIVEELTALKEKYPRRFNVSYYADDTNRFITTQDVRRQLQSPTSLNPQDPAAQDPSKKLVLISGPDGFVAHFAGPKVWRGGKETQGELGGVLRKLNPIDWTVWKL